MKCPMCDGTGNTVITHGGECDCSYCGGSGEVSNKGLYTVEVSFDMVVWAEDEQDAMSVANDHARDELDSARYFVSANPEMNVDWEDGIPYGDEPDGFEGLTVREIIKKKMEIALAFETKNYVDPNQLELF